MQHVGVKEEEKTVCQVLWRFLLLIHPLIIIFSLRNINWISWKQEAAEEGFQPCLKAHSTLADVPTLGNTSLVKLASCLLLSWTFAQWQVLHVGFLLGFRLPGMGCCCLLGFWLQFTVQEGGEHPVSVVLGLVGTSELLAHTE